MRLLRYIIFFFCFSSNLLWGDVNEVSKIFKLPTSSFVISNKLEEAQSKYGDNIISAVTYELIEYPGSRISIVSAKPGIIITAKLSKKFNKNFSDSPSEMSQYKIIIKDKAEGYKLETMGPYGEEIAFLLEVPSRNLELAVKYSFRSGNYFDVKESASQYFEIENVEEKLLLLAEHTVEQLIRKNDSPNEMLHPTNNDTTTSHYIDIPHSDVSIVRYDVDSKSDLLDIEIIEVDDDITIPWFWIFIAILVLSGGYFLKSNKSED